MKLHRIVLSAVFLLNAVHVHATERFVSLTGGHTAPFLNWADAATNIQEAIDASSAGDVVWVTNGVYSAGGKVMAGDLTNRVALDKALTVRSVNGPEQTLIQGNGMTNGLLAIRCAWLTNGASLNGFTLENGATRMCCDILTIRGGGVWCASSNSIVENCVIRSNTCNNVGGAVYQGSLKNCFITQNNSASPGVVVGAALNHCTVISNLSVGIQGGTLTNCVVYFNTQANYFSGAFSYTCTTPLPSGTGNIASDPQLLYDNLHFSTTSPCRSSGTNTGGTDIFGQPWGNPPSMGCLEWPVTPFAAEKPEFRFFSPAGFAATVGVVGQGPFTFYWMHNGVPVENDEHYDITETGALAVKNLKLSDAGSYQAVASNSFGSVTSAVSALVIHTVDAAGTGPVPPYSTWVTAATNIQDAIDVAAAGEFVLVTNGVYQTGGKSMEGVLTNRIAIDKPLFVMGVNGAEVTTIRGNIDSATNGPTAIRCAWMTNGAVLSGFTIRGGATRPYSPSSNNQMFGGGVWGATNAQLFDCVISSNYASYWAGGAYGLSLSNCILSGNYVGMGSPGSGVVGSGGGGAMGCILKNCSIIGNTAIEAGGGTFSCILVNCSLTKNLAYRYGSAAYFGSLVNCTVTENTCAGSYGGAVAEVFLTNCIVISNRVTSVSAIPTNYYNATSTYSCTFPLLPGVGNIAVDPKLLADGTHLAIDSPCHASGINSVVSGTDIDGQPWANPPSMGCDEWHPEPALGGETGFQVSGVPASLKLIGAKAVGGESPFTFFWLKNGVALGESSRYSIEGPNLLVANVEPADAGSYQLVASNAFGVATSSIVCVKIHGVDVAGSSPVPPYSTWATAATNIQDAIDIAESGDVILVTNGIYASGGKVISGNLTNRVALTKPITVVSVNGPAATIIQGNWDANTNGPLAVRCAWLANNAVLNGFTLLGGATRTNGDVTLQNGGGVWGVSTQAVVMNCWIYTNAAAGDGGGSFQATLNRCRIIGNRAYKGGGGAAYGLLENSFVRENIGTLFGGGAFECNVINCTVVQNTAQNGGGVSAFNSTTRNSIIYSNYRFFPEFYPDEYVGSGQYITYCCVFSQFGSFPGTGNFSSSPQFTDQFHLAITSPCRGAGSALYASGADIDGEPWLNPPSIGCDEVIEENINGPLSVSAMMAWSEVVERQYGFLIGEVSGRAARLEWNFGDGSILTNVSALTPNHVWTNAGDYNVTFTAYNHDFSNGVSTNFSVHVVPVIAPTFLSMELNGANFTLNFLGQSNVNGVVEYTTNLTDPITWQTVGSSYSYSNVIQSIDRKATNAARFYRVRIP